MRFAAVSSSGSITELDPGRVLVFVGPNNSGKSLALKEIETWSAGVEEDRRVVSELEAEFPINREDAFGLLGPLKADRPQQQPSLAGQHWFFAGELTAGTARGAFMIGETQIDDYLANRAVRSLQLRQLLLRVLTARLDGHTRFQLSSQQPCGDLQEPAANHLGALFRDGDARRNVREITAQAFPVGPRYFVIEFTGEAQLRIRMSLREPEDEDEEQALTQRARDFHSSATELSQMGDGVRAFTGLVAAIVSLPHRTLLVDEPEAFLHPTLGRRLGSNLAALAAERQTTLIAATHSAEFLMGCIDAGPPVNVVRLTYDAGSGVGTARSLPPGQLRSLMTDPLLRSTSALDGIFHRAVIVTEADADRAFYDEINHRMVRVGRGVADAMFSNAQNWQTIARIVGPLRRLGIPAAAIMDLDALNGSGTEWKKILDVMNLDMPTRATMQNQRAACKTILARVPQHKKKGLVAISPTDRSTVKQFVDDLGRYGIFLVPVGQLEGWLSTLAVAGPKPRWIVQMFRTLGSDPDEASYVKPGRGNVWTFLERIASWVNDAARLGIAD